MYFGALVGEYYFTKLHVVCVFVRYVNKPIRPSYATSRLRFTPASRQPAHCCSDIAAGFSFILHRGIVSGDYCEILATIQFSRIRYFIFCTILPSVMLSTVCVCSILFRTAAIHTYTGSVEISHLVETEQVVPRPTANVYREILQTSELLADF
jgi:hypothetical protein